MTEKTIELLLVKEIANVQKLNGIPNPSLSSATLPIGGLSRFDSLTAIEVLMSLEVKIEKKLGREVDLDVSLFFTDKGRKGLKKGMTQYSLSISAIAKNICHSIRSTG